MVGVTDKPVEFELSMGNKGTKFDESVAHSNTTPCKPVSDGSHYYHLPWGQEKPCVWIECQWEDIAFRIEPLNILNRTRESLEEELEEVKVLPDDENGLEQMTSVFINFVQTCKVLMKYFQDEASNSRPSSLKLSDRTNTLDKQILSLRIKELTYLIEDAEAFRHKPEEELNKEKVIVELRNYIRRIKSMAMEPQLSMPDVILWMICGDKRIAYYRIPAHDILHSEKVITFENSKESHARGKLCGKVIELPLKYPGREVDVHLKMPALVRLELWLGLRKHQKEWIKRQQRGEGDFRVYAETYENETRKSKKGWESSKSPHWPNYSDVAGQLKLPKPESSSDSFIVPKGWKFSTDWEESLLTTIRYPDENVTLFTDEVYEHESRNFPGGDWKSGEPRYVDVFGDETTLATDPPTGWTVPGAGPGADNAGWSVDQNRAVDEEGWEYSAHPTYFEFAPEEKAFHLSRRRRMIRLRKRNPDQQAHKGSPPTDGWEYSRSLHESFHPDVKRTDYLRRRRLLRQIEPIKSSKEYGWDEAKFPVFKVLVKGKTGKESALCVLPRMFVRYECVHIYTLWVSIYQARGLIAQDDTGRNDPYVRVAFINKSQKTNMLPQTLCPTWDQTLIFEQLEIFGNPEDLADNPPSVVMELFDHDKGKHDFLGRCMCKPKVLLERDPPKGKLAWHKIRRGEQDGGQILAECELFLVHPNGPKLPALPEKREGVYPIRDDGLRPATQKKAIEILSWGLRDLKASKPSVEFECNYLPRHDRNQEIIKSDEVISDMKKCPNFSQPVLERADLELPVDEEYSPPFSIRVYDNSWFGKSLIGLCEIPSLKNFPVEDQSSVDGQPQDTVTLEEKVTDRRGKRPVKPKSGRKSQQDLVKYEEDFNWWSKYYASMDGQTTSTTSEDGDWSSTNGIMSHIKQYSDRSYDTLTIYPDTLERQFEGFNDFVTSFPLRRGKTKTTKDGDTVVGQFKGAFRVITDFPDEDYKVNSMENRHLPSKDLVNCIVRVYIVCASQLQPKDSDGLADPYVTVSLGGKSQGKRSEHIVKTLNPVFGRMFEFEAKIPLVKDLKIQVWDYDFPPPDDLIGETEIDLEQRVLSKHHATCGVPKTYFKSGPFKWRDTLTPFQLLAKYCTLTGKELVLHKKKKPEFIDEEDGDSVDSELGEPLQQLALDLLHTKCDVVPEHVETRPLYSRERPGMEQGKLLMWVDIFTEEDEKLAEIDPSEIGKNQTDGTQPFTVVKRPPRSKEEKAEARTYAEDQVEGVKEYLLDRLLKPPISILPPQPIKYELRVIVWNTADVILDDTNLFGEKMSDIFVEAWIVGEEHKEQRTSVHERSLDGNGSFNWRMVFPLEYLPFKKQIVIRKKVHLLSRDVKEDERDPILKVLIYDKDRLSGSDFLGDRDLNLSKLVRPCDHPSQCDTSKDPSKQEVPEVIDLFKTELKTGWWACYGKTRMTGKVEMTLEILDEEKAKANPVGRGQSEPNQNPTLPKPIRPSHSFLWYLHPFKTFKHIIWRNNKRFFIQAVVFCMLVLLIAYFVYSIPSYAAKRVVGA